MTILQEHDVQFSSQQYTWQPTVQANKDNHSEQYQCQHHLGELYNTTSDNHPKRHSVKALTLTFTTTPKTKGKQPHNTCTAPPVANDSIKQPAENRSVQERNAADAAAAAALIVLTCLIKCSQMFLL